MNQQNPLLFFHKSFRNAGIPELIERAHQIGLEGFDLVCRKGFPVNPENIKTALPDAVKQLERGGLVAPMLSGEANLLDPTDPTAEPIMGAMQQSGVKYLKLGYFTIKHSTEDYWDKVAEVRGKLAGWAKLAEKFQVKVCYHTHSGSKHLGFNASATMHLFQDLDPKWMGVYLDPGHLMIEGEAIDAAVNMTSRYLSLVGLKDMRKEHNPVGYGYRAILTRIGFGMVDWDMLFKHLARVKFQGPFSIHGEFERNYPGAAQAEPPEFMPALKEEVAFYRRLRDQWLRAG